jgi:putative hydrolase of the HAD superfamily
MSAAQEIDIVLFDLGGVLFDFGGVDGMKALASIDDDEELWRRWLGCPWVRAFERGGCSQEDFAAGVVDEWGLAVAPEEFLRLFRSWLGGPLAGAESLVEETRRAVPVGCLSNTNAVHWGDHENRWSLFESFDARFLSFEIGCVKPDAEIFDHVAASLAVPRDRILFLDDNVINVEGATAAGFRSVRTVGVDAARTHLVELGVLRSR